MGVIVDVTSDVICPWCYIGKRRPERAVRALGGRHEVRVRWHPFQLDMGRRLRVYGRRLGDRS